VAEFRSARVKEGIAVVSLRLPRRQMSPLAVGVAAATVVTVGLAAAPVLADPVREYEWWLTEVHVTQAWQINRGAGVTVAVLDTGVDPNQADLSRSVTTGPDYTHSGRHLGDIYWGVHGTAMAALIAGHGHGPRHADGIIGVAPRARIVSVRVNLEETDPLRADTGVASRLPAAIASGIRYAVHDGAQVIDLPLDPGAASVDGTPGAAAAAGGSAAERSAIAYALVKGVVLVAPAGDDGLVRGQVNYPAAYRGVVSVGAFNKGLARARFSNARPYATLTAPGENVITATSETTYGTVSSTSAASAEVAGIAALVRAQYPGLTPAQVSQALMGGARLGRPADRKNGSRYETADARGALSAAARIEAAGRPASAAPTAPPSLGQPVSAPLRNEAALVRAAIIGASALLALVLLAVLVWANRHRKHAGGRPAYMPAPAEPGSTVVSAASPDAHDDDALSNNGERTRQPPQLAPIPELGAGKRARQAAGPPWEPAPKPDSEPPWGAQDTNGDGGGRGLPHRPGLNGRSDAIWRAAPGPAGPQAPPDPAAEPVAGPPVTPGSGIFRVPPALATGGVPWGAPPSPGGGDAALGAAPRLPGLDGPPENLRPAGRAAGSTVDPPPARRTGDGQTADPEQEAGPIYVWNPGAKTEEFHAVSGGLPPGGDNGQPAPTHPAGTAASGQDTQAFPAVAPADHAGYPAGHGDYSEDDGGDYHLDARGGFPEEDEDDRHL
jgi:hypothetical protein